MTSMRLPPPPFRPIARPHALDRGQSLRINFHGTSEHLIIPHFVKFDEIAVLAAAILRHPDLTDADALHARESGDRILRGAVINNIFNKVHENASPRHSLGGSEPYLRFSSGLCHNPVTSLQLSRLFLLTSQPTTTCSADESPLLGSPTSAGRRRQQRQSSSIGNSSRESGISYQRLRTASPVAVTHSRSADVKHRTQSRGASADPRVEPGERRQPCGVRGHWSPNQQSAAVTSVTHRWVLERAGIPVGRRRRSCLDPLGWFRAAAVTHLPDPAGSSPSRITAGGCRLAHAPPAFSSLHQGRSPRPVADAAAHRANQGDAATHSLETRFRRRSP